MTTFGEALIRLSPPDGIRLEGATQMGAWVAGAELNAAIGLARLGAQTSWISVLPDSALGRTVLSHARAHGVDVGDVVLTAEERMALFFVDVGDGARPTTTIYDRAGSAFAGLGPGLLDWERILTGVSAFHTTGITPAISLACEDEAGRALSMARSLGCHTSYDVNFRGLMTTPAAARATLERLAANIDTVLISGGEAAAVFGLEGAAEEIAPRLRDVLGVRAVVVSVRVDGEDGTQVRRSTYAGNEVFDFVSPSSRILDPLGAGDAFAAGFLHGLLTEGVQRGLAVGAALAALKQSISGDAAIVTPAEVEQLLESPQIRTVR